VTPRVRLEYLAVRRARKSDALARAARAVAAGVVVLGFTLLAAVGVARAAIWYGERQGGVEHRR
jgi:hypothetical protein